MNRTVPALLQAHLDSGETTTCELVKITPRIGIDGDPPAPLGVTSLDRDVTYDDGDGEITYVSAIGVEHSTRASTADMAIDNAEATALVALAEFDQPATEEQLNAGLYDFATWVGYLVNYEDLTMGHTEIGRGTLGQVRTLNAGQSFTFEELGQTQDLKQSIVQRDSLRCRARFGSQPIGTVGAESTERFPCGKDTTAMWVAFVVTAVDANEPQFSFDTDLVAADNAYRPGLVRWTVGRNAGRQYEVEAHATGVLTTAFPMTYAAEVGDEGEVRADCVHWFEGDNSCQTHFAADWILHYRGEPYIPVGEQDQINIPGANG